MKKIKRLYLFIFALAIAVALAFVSIGNRVAFTLQGKVLQQPVVVIDAGHGGPDGGARGVDGAVEKDINLSIALKLGAMIEPLGYRVVYTRTTDTDLSDPKYSSIRSRKHSDLLNRLALAEGLPGCIFVSVHQNMFGISRYSGAQVFYGSKDESSKALAGEIQRSIIELVQPQNTRQIKRSTDALFLLQNIPSPAVLVECGFLSNPEECAKLQSDDYQNNICFAILAGLLRHQESAGNSQ